jgi:hypothetical protein
MGLCECRGIVYYGMGRDEAREEFEGSIISLNCEGSSVVALESKPYAHSRTLVFFHGNSESAFQSKALTDIL